MSRVAELECAAALGSRDPKRHRAGSMIADAVRYVRAQRETAGLTQCVGQHDRKCSLSCAEAVDHPHFVEVLARGCPVASSVASWSIVGRSESAYSCWAPPHGSQRCRPSPRASFATPISLKGACPVRRADPASLSGQSHTEIHDYHDTATGVLIESMVKRAAGYTSLGFPTPATSLRHPVRAQPKEITDSLA
jgi:hypothetical protein